MTAKLITVCSYKQKVQADIHRRLQGCERHFQLRGILQGLAEIVRRTFQVTVETVPLQEGATTRIF